MEAPASYYEYGTPSFSSQFTGGLELPDNPSARLPFSIRIPDRNPYSNFDPVYFPSRFNELSEKDLRREGQQCEGEDVSIKKQKNADIHVTGIVLSNQVPVLKNLYRYQGEVDLLSPLEPNGGMSVLIQSGEVGNWQGWDRHHNQHQWEYTMQLVSTGEDEFDNDERNDIVSEIVGP